MTFNDESIKYQMGGLDIGALSACDLLMCSQTGKYLLSEAREPCDEVQKNIRELLMLPSKESKLPNFTPSHPPICTLIDIRYWW